MQPNLKKAVSYINKHGIALAYPVKGKSGLPSLWDCFYPKSEMVWEWDEDGDDRVALIWHLRARLSDSRKVLYTKWFQQRATFLSLKLGTALLSLVSGKPHPFPGLSREAINLYSALEDDSPLPTKLLRLQAGLEGKTNESAFNRGLRELWARLLIVGYGEVEEGGFPSLAVGATKLLFEEQWEDSMRISEEERQEVLKRYLYSSALLSRQYKRFESLSSAVALSTHARL